MISERLQQDPVPPHTANLQLVPSSWGGWSWSEAEMESPKGFRRRRRRRDTPAEKNEIKRNEDEEGSRMGVQKMHQLPGGDERFFYVQLLPSRNLLHVVTSVMEIKA